MSRPRGWYGMTYEQQREWDNKERECRREREDLEQQAESERLRSEAADARRRREVAAAREDYSSLAEDHDRTCERLHDVRAALADLVAATKPLVARAGGEGPVVVRPDPQTDPIARVAMAIAQAEGLLQ